MATELQQFAIDNGLLLHDRVTPDEFEDMRADFDGNCLSGSGVKCPCDAAKSITALSPVENQVCDGSMFVTKAYREHWETQDSLSSSEPADEELKAAATEILDTVEAAEDAINRGEFNEATEILREKAESSNCGTCAALLSAEAVRAQAVGEICGVDKQACGKDMKRLHERYGELRKLTREIGDLKPETVSPYRACIKNANDKELDTIVSGLTERRRHGAKMAIKAKMCGKAKLTAEAAFREYLAAHPEVSAV
jgi:hypothetical protein